jgi:hypothetical protein
VLVKPTQNEFIKPLSISIEYKALANSAPQQLRRLTYRKNCWIYRNFTHFCCTNITAQTGKNGRYGLLVIYKPVIYASTTCRVYISSNKQMKKK